jgi:hypothetical protein
MFWNLFKKKPAPKLEPEKKDLEPQPMRLDDFCKDREGYFTGNGHPVNTDKKLTKLPVNYPRAKYP